MHGATVEGTGLGAGPLSDVGAGPLRRGPCVLAAW